MSDHFTTLQSKELIQAQSFKLSDNSSVTGALKTLFIFFHLFIFTLSMLLLEMDKQINNTFIDKNSVYILGRTYPWKTTMDEFLLNIKPPQESCKDYVQFANCLKNETKILTKIYLIYDTKNISSKNNFINT